MHLIGLLALLCQELPLQVSDDVEFRVRLRAWHPWIDGGAKGKEDNPMVAFDDDLDVDAPGWVPVFEAGLFVPPGRDVTGRGAAISGMSYATSGEERLDSDETFEGSVFAAGTTLRSRLRFQTVGLDAVLWGRDAADETFAWRFAIGAHYLEAELRLSGAGLRESEEYSDANLKFSLWGEIRPLPWVFLAGTVAVYTDFISLVFGVDSGHYGMDLEAVAGLSLYGVRLEAGLRLLAWTLNWWESEIDLVSHGPFAGLTVRF